MKDHSEKHEQGISVFGLFHDEESLRRAVQALIASGFDASDVSALLPEQKTTHAFAHEKHTKAPEGAVIGGAIGAVIGIVLGALAGDGAFPGIDIFVAAGPLIMALAGLGAVGVLGALIGAIAGMRIPEYVARRYESFVHRGGALVSAHCSDREAEHRARTLLDGFGATDISERREERTPKIARAAN